MGSPEWKHCMNLPQRSWSFSGTSRRCRLRWHNGVSSHSLRQTPLVARLAILQRPEPPATSRWRQLPPCLGLHRFPTDLRLCYPPPPPLAPSHASLGAPPGAAVGPRGVAGAPGASGAWGTRARGGRLARRTAGGALPLGSP